jgi:glycine/D-amino acid oxidase-like deaminating enzyme
MSVQKMETPRIGSFDNEYGRQNGRLVLPRSLWTETKKESVSTKPLAGKSETEVTIIGGGITGLSAALHLREWGREVTVLEAGEIGWGGSGRNGGHFNPGWKVDPEEILNRHGKQRGERMVQMADQTCDLVIDIISRHAIDCDVVRNGYIQAAVGNNDLKVVAEKARQWMQRGAPVEILDKSAIRNALGSDYYVGGQLDLRGGHLQPLSYVCGLARVAMQQEAQVHSHSPALNISHTQNEWMINTPQGEVQSKFLLIGTNAYTGTLWPKLKRTLVPVTSFIAVTEPIPDGLRHQILPGQTSVSEIRRIPLYFIVTNEGRLVIGGRGNTFNTDQSGATRHIQKIALQIYPLLARVNWEYNWGGLVAITMDREPHIFKIGTNAYAGLAYNGRGVPMATMMGKQLADLICGEDIPMPVQPLRPIAFHRFAQIGISFHIIAGRLLDRMQ